MSTPQNAVTAEPGNGSAAIRARVGDSAIDKVTRLFSAGLADIFTETLQNSRRGGANRVAATIEQDGDSTRVTLIDDGVGIADPAVLLTFGESNWKAGIAEAEDPAGFGLLALSRRGCMLRWRVPGGDPSPGYRLVLEPAHFLGRDAAHVVPDDSAPWPHGTAVTFEASEAPHAVRAFLETAARHYPLPVTIGDETVERRAFLDGALHAEPWKGLVFGVFKDSHAGYRIPDINFHGLTLPVRLPQIDTVEGGVWSARADIDSCPDLELVLPARKEAVETPFLEEMREAARLAVYRAMAQADPAPRLAWTDWHKAKEAGIEMPEPPAELRPWRPAIADTDYWDERSAFTAVGSDTLVMQADPEPPEAQALHRALGLRVRPETLCRITEFSEHESNGRELDEGERVAVEVLPVLGQSAAAVEPGDGAFDHPTPGLDDEALHPIGSLDDLGLEIGQDAGQGAVKDRALIGAVGEQFPEKGKQTEQGRQQRETAVAILNVGGGDDAVQQQALRIDQNMPLLALDQLAGIEAVAVDASPPFSALFTL